MAKSGPVKNPMKLTAIDAAIISGTLPVSLFSSITTQHSKHILTAKTPVATQVLAGNIETPFFARQNDESAQQGEVVLVDTHR